MTKALRILILEDRPADAELVTRELRKAGFEFVAKNVATEQEYLAALRGLAPQLILSDYSLPGYDGLSALAAAQQQCPGTPFIFVSGSMGEEKAIGTLHHGATDYVLKNHLARLGPAVRRALREQEEMRKRKQAEKERKESEEQLRAMFDLASIGIASADPRTGQWLRVNQKMCALTGYSAAEMLRMKVPEITHPDDRQKDWEAFQRVVRGEAPDYRLEKRYVRKDGAVTWVNVNMTVIRDAAGQPTRTVAMIEDITGRRQAEQRVQELNLVRRATGAINALMVRERDPQRLLAEACKILVETRGYQLAWIGQVEPGSKRVVPAACFGKHTDYLDAVTIRWDDTPAGRGPTGTAIRTGQPVVCQDTATDLRFAPWTEAAKARGLASTAAMPMIHSSRVVGAVCVYSDRTEAFKAEELELLKELAADLAFALQSIEHEQKRKRAETSVRENEQRYRLLFNSGYDAVFVHEGPDAQGQPGKFLEVNDIACQRLGYTREELLQMSPFDIDTPESARAFPGIVKRLDKERHATWEAVNVTKDGRRFPVEISSELFQLNGKPAYLSTIRDITERKQAEAALRESSQFNQEVVASAQEGVVVYGRDLKYQVWNPFMEQLTGLPANQVLGKHPDELFPFLRDAGLLAAIEKVLAGEPTSAIEIHVEDQPTGLSGWTYQTNGPLRNAVGEIIGVIGTVQDITERKRAELRITAFANLGQRLNTAKSAREAAEIIVNVADDLFKWDACLFDLYSAAENRTTHVLNMDLIEGRRTECKQRYPDPTPRKLSKRAIEQGGQLILQEQSEPIRTEGSPFGDTSRPSASIMFVPVRHGTEVVGVLSIQSYTPKAYDAYSLETLQALADYGGGTLERLRAQEALGESEVTFRSVWEHSVDGMRLTDKEGRIIAVNEAFCRLVKLPREKLEGQFFPVAYKGEGPCGSIEAYRQRFAKADVVPLITARAQISNGEEAELEISNSFVELGQHGKMLLSIFRDVSERKRAEARIKAFSNLGHRLSGANTASEAARIISEVAGELLGWDACSFSLCVPPNDFVNHVLNLDTVAGRRVEFSPGLSPPSVLARRAMEVGGQLILKDKPDEMLPGSDPFGDETRPSASIIYVPIRKGSEVIGVMSIQSYTPGAYDARSLETLQALADHCGGALDRLRAEAELKRSHDQYHQAITAANAIPYQKVYGADRYVFMGEGIKELTGYAPDELCSGVWKEMILETVFLGEAAGLPLAEAARRTRAGEIKNWRADHRIRTRSGAIRWLSDCSVQLLDADGKFCGSMGIIQDITQRKELETQLRQSQKMEAVGQLAGGVAHDFNNMLAVIRGNAELLLMDEDQHTAETREGLKHVVEASERAANLTRQLLAFSRKQVLLPQPLVLNEVITNLIKMLKRVIGENINLQCDYAAPLAHIQADTGMMEQVILNLVVNARDAMPGGGHLRVATEQLTLDEAHAAANPAARPGEFVCLRVTDTGTGIAPEVLPRIFEPFFTTKDVGKGTGLGLATAYGIVQQHQGWIEVSSQIGEGTTFKVFLPAIPAPAQLAAAAKAEEAVRGGAETILLVEDEHSVRITTRRVLENKGYTVREAATAREALELWQRHAEEIALLLTDIIMPGEMTGRDLAEQLWGQKPGLKVIFMSGYSAEVLGKGTEFIRRTKSHFLQKPATSRMILETVRLSLDVKERVAAPGKAGSPT